MSEYEAVFDSRGDLYNKATELCPEARESERRLLIELLPLVPGQFVCDAPAGGGYLADGLAELGAKVVCVEPSAEFAKAIADNHKTYQGSLTSLPIAVESMDHVASLAGLHHLENVQDFFRESYRVLKPGGYLAVADVKLGTPVAEFLNGPVDELSETGHFGRFFTEDSLREGLEGCGFEASIATHHQFTWDFPNLSTMLEYSWNLFGLTKTEPHTLEAVLGNAPGYTMDDTGAKLHWSLIYAKGRKPD